MTVQSTDTIMEQEVDVAREGVVCILAEWFMPQCSVLESVDSIPTWVLPKVFRENLR